MYSRLTPTQQKWTKIIGSILGAAALVLAGSAANPSTVITGGHQGPSAAQRDGTSIESRVQRLEDSDKRHQDDLTHIRDRVDKIYDHMIEERTH